MILARVAGNSQRVEKRFRTPDGVKVSAASRLGDSLHTAADAGFAGVG
jgi:hypothetical protein